MVFNFLIYDLFTSVFKLLKLLAIVFNLLTPNLSTSAVKPTKSYFPASLDVSTPVAFFKSAFVAY